MVYHILISFRDAIVSFLDELIEQFPNEGDLIVMRIFLKDQIEIVSVMEIFCSNLAADDFMLKQMIIDRNEVFFLEHNIFDFLGKGKVNRFKNMWIALHEDDKKIVWNWFDTFIHYSEKYKE